MNISSDPRDEERKLPTNTMLYRIELRCAQAWAEAYFLFEQERGDLQRFRDLLSWKRAWIQIHELRYGRTVAFVYGHSEYWRTVAPGVAVKP